MFKFSACFKYENVVSALGSPTVSSFTDGIVEFVGNYVRLEYVADYGQIQNQCHLNIRVDDIGKMDIVSIGDKTASFTTAIGRKFSIRFLTLIEMRDFLLRLEKETDCDFSISGKNILGLIFLCEMRGDVFGNAVRFDISDSHYNVENISVKNEQFRAAYNVSLIDKGVCNKKHRFEVDAPKWYKRKFDLNDIVFV